MIDNNYLFDYLNPLIILQISTWATNVHECKPKKEPYLEEYYLPFMPVLRI
jgi:hypothetical protein